MTQNVNCFSNYSNFHFHLQCINLCSLNSWLTNLISKMLNLILLYFFDYKV